ncbi:MAG: chromosomal replication initiator protein DnaA [Phycisphaerae bacterium]|nr:chromosomal replication initiator protein DnaA [Phycisphaerae bacterium]
MQATFTDEITAIDQAIAERIGPQKHRIWFKNSTRLTLADNYLKVGVPNHFIGGWIENHFLDEIAAAVRGVTGGDRKIAFNIEPELSGALKRPQLDSQALHVEKAHNRTTRSRIRPAEALHRLEPLKLSLDNFVVGPKNQLAYNAARAVVDSEQSPFNPLFFHGGYGVGKTHLLQGICNAVCKTRPKARWLYVSAEDFANQYVLALKTRKLDAFRARFRQTDLLAIDDIHFLASKKAMQEEFLHTFNTIDLAGKQVVLASDAHPKMIGSLCESLVNRFVSGMVVKIEAPDFETRCKICAQRVASMDQDVPMSVVEYVAERMATNVRELEGALIKLIAYASLTRERVSLIMAREVLADHISRTDPIVHVSDIESAVSTYFGITTADVHSSRKDRTVSLARSYSMHLARKFTKMSFPEIGKVMGNKNHATVILANRKVEDLINRNAEVKWKNAAGFRVARARDIYEQLMESIS